MCWPDLETHSTLQPSRNLGAAMTQLELVPKPPPAQHHSVTSVQAAERIEPDAKTLRHRVLMVLKVNGGLTDEEMQLGIPMNPSTQRPRRIELVNMGLVVDSGLTRLTRSGRKATVWRATR